MAIYKYERLRIHSQHAAFDSDSLPRHTGAVLRHPSVRGLRIRGVFDRGQATPAGANLRRVRLQVKVCFWTGPVAARGLRPPHERLETT